MGADGVEDEDCVCAEAGDEIRTLAVRRRYRRNEAQVFTETTITLRAEAWGGLAACYGRGTPNYAHSRRPDMGGTFGKAVAYKCARGRIP